MFASDPFGTPNNAAKRHSPTAPNMRPMNKDQILRGKSPSDISFATGTSRDPSNVPSEGSHQQLIFKNDHTKSPMTTG